MMNHHRHLNPDDVRNTLIVTFLSYVEYFHPKYFLLENVQGMLKYKLMGDPDHVDGVTDGVVKFLLRAATALG